jgi:hypothetical protein|tara:strand:+ start:1641 stop:1871 length:231 start_codon:yes stop_codon:yes gene_type:complete
MWSPKVIKALRIAYVYSLTITMFCMAMGTASILSRDGKSIELITGVGVLSATALIGSTLVLHRFASRYDGEDPFED